MVFYLVKFAFYLRLLFYYCYYHINGEIKIYIDSYIYYDKLSTIYSMFI